MPLRYQTHTELERIALLAKLCRLQGCDNDE
jgi:hypothetical protein